LCGDMGMGLCWLVKRGRCSSEKTLPGPQVALWGRRMGRRQGESPGRVLAGCLPVKEGVISRGGKDHGNQYTGGPGWIRAQGSRLGCIACFPMLLCFILVEN
jgi:hypothetical protein